MTRAAVLPVFVAAIAAAQQDTPTPTFRSGTKLVEVDVVARSKGAPATGLTKDDFTLLDNGKPQKIAFFSVQSGNVAPPPIAGVAPLPAGEVSNRLERADRPTGNTVIVFLDQRNTPPPEQAFAIQRIANRSISTVKTDGDPFDPRIHNHTRNFLGHQGPVGCQGNAQAFIGTVTGQLKNVGPVKWFPAAQHENRISCRGDLVDDSQRRAGGQIGG